MRSTERRGLGSSYLTAIVNDFSADLRNETAAQSRISAAPAVRITPQYKFNPHLNYQVYMVPALMVMLLTIVCGFMPALNIVSEKRSGRSNRSTCRRSANSSSSSPS